MDMNMDSGIADDDLIRFQADTLFSYDARGRMVQSNEPCVAARRPAPRLFLGRTRTAYVVRFGATLPDTLVGRLKAIVERQAPLDDLDTPPAALAALREALEQHTPITAESGGSAYRFPTSITPPGEVIRLTHANRELVRETYPWLYDEMADWQPCFAMVHDGAAVSICFSSRSGDAVAEAGVDTLPDFRGRGYAGAVTAAWSAAIRKSGRTPIYSTDWENVASQRVARRLGLIRFGVDASWA